jgi:hypothetical protein
MVLRENRDTFDFDRLHREIKAHGLEGEYRSIWIDAYPGERLPEGF